MFFQANGRFLPFENLKFKNRSFPLELAVRVFFFIVLLNFECLLLNDGDSKCSDIPPFESNVNEIMIKWRKKNQVQWVSKVVVFQNHGRFSGEKNLSTFLHTYESVHVSVQSSHIYQNKHLHFPCIFKQKKKKRTKSWLVKVEKS